MKRKNYIIAAIVATMLAGCSSTPAPSDVDAGADQQIENSENQAEGEELLTDEEEAAKADPVDADGDGIIDPVESGTYEIDDLKFYYKNNVPYDEGGHMRISVIYDDTDLNEYAADYFDFFYRDPTEIHYIVNLGLKTTTRIDKFLDDQLYITVYEYVDGEENKGNLTASGDILQEYLLNKETGEVDPVEDDE